jgi:16S rRNA (guanine966-N2)-methyltransferase
MSEKMRGALFSSLGDIKGLDVLDLYAGSGALSVEAISRGAKSTLAIDNDKTANESMKAAAFSLGIEDKMYVLRARFSPWSDRNADTQFDIVLIDPPYDDLPGAVLNKASRHLKSRGVLVLSWPGRLPPPEMNDSELVSNKKYGDSQLVFYKKIS